MTFYKAAKTHLKKKRAETNSKIKAALKGLTPRNATLTFDLTRGDKGTKIDQNKNASIKAIELVSGLIDGFGLPSRPKLSFCGMVKSATSRDGNIEEGVIRLNAILSTLMGHRASIDIPVIVHSKSLLEPALFFYDGAPYIFCAPALSQLIKRGTLQKDPQLRRMYSAPLLAEVAKDLPRQPIINREHMFDSGVRNPWKFKRYSQKDESVLEKINEAISPMTPRKTLDMGPEGKWVPMQESDVEGARLSPYAEAECEKCGYSMPASEAGCRNCGNMRRPVDVKMQQKTTPSQLFEQEEGLEKAPTLELEASKKQAQKKTHKGEPRKRVNIEDPVQFPEVWEKPKDHLLDPAERDIDDNWAVGDIVTADEDIEVRERGGSQIIIPSGESGQVMKDIYGDGLMLDVCFEDLGFHAVVPSKMLKGASRRPFDKEADIRPVDTAIQEVLKDIPYPGGTSIGYKLSGLSIEQIMDKDPAQAYKIISQKYPNLIPQFLKIMQGKSKIPSTSVKAFNKFYAFIAKTAATVDQVKYEVRELLREGYRPIDIRQAIQNKYPDQAEEVLAGLNK